MATKKPIYGNVHATSKRKTNSKSEWNSNFTDDDKYKLSQEEVLRRKKLYISKHNILTSSPNTFVSMKSNVKSGKRRHVVRATRKSTRKNILDDSGLNDEDDLSTALDDITSLDLLTGDEEVEVDSSHSRRVATTSGSVHKKTTPAPARRRLRTVQPQTRKQTLTTSAVSPPPPPSPMHTPIKMNDTSSKPSPQDRDIDKDRDRGHCTPKPSRKTAGAGAGGAGHLSLTQREMRDIGAMVDLLNQEVSYYEQLTGKKSAIDIEVSSSLV